MYLRKINRPEGVYLAIQESYYDSSSKQSRTRTVQSLGYLDTLKLKHDDPIAFFTPKAFELTEEKKKEPPPSPFIPIKKWTLLQMISTTLVMAY